MTRWEVEQRWLHFTGDGWPEGMILIELASGEATHVTAMELVAIFRVAPAAKPGQLSHLSSGMLPHSPALILSNPTRALASLHSKAEWQ